jgi:hypothetical protein
MLYFVRVVATLDHERSNDYKIGSIGPFTRELSRSTWIERFRKALDELNHALGLEQSTDCIDAELRLFEFERPGSAGLLLPASWTPAATADKIKERYTALHPGVIE